MHSSAIRALCHPKPSLVNSLAAIRTDSPRERHASMDCEALACCFLNVFTEKFLSRARLSRRERGLNALLNFRGGILVREIGYRLVVADRRVWCTVPPWFRFPGGASLAIDIFKEQRSESKNAFTIGARRFASHRSA